MGAGGDELSNNRSGSNKAFPTTLGLGDFLGLTLYQGPGSHGTAGVSQEWEEEGEELDFVL